MFVLRFGNIITLFLTKTGSTNAATTRFEEVSKTHSGGGSQYWPDERSSVRQSGRFFHLTHNARKNRLAFICYQVISPSLVTHPLSGDVLVTQLEVRPTITTGPSGLKSRPAQIEPSPEVPRYIFHHH